MSTLTIAASEPKSWDSVISKLLKIVRKVNTCFISGSHWNDSNKRGILKLAVEQKVALVSKQKDHLETSELNEIVTNTQFGQTIVFQPFGLIVPKDDDEHLSQAMDHLRECRTVESSP